MATPTYTTFIALFQDDVHEVIFKDMKPETLDQYFNYLEDLFKTIPQDQKINILLNTPAGLPSFQNLATRDRAIPTSGRPLRKGFSSLLHQYDAACHQRKSSHGNADLPRPEKRRCSGLAASLEHERTDFCASLPQTMVK